MSVAGPARMCMEDSLLDTGCILDGYCHTSPTRSLRNLPVSWASEHTLRLLHNLHACVLRISRLAGPLLAVMTMSLLIHSLLDQYQMLDETGERSRGCRRRPPRIVGDCTVPSEITSPARTEGNGYNPLLSCHTQTCQSSHRTRCHQRKPHTLWKTSLWGHTGQCGWSVSGRATRG